MRSQHDSRFRSLLVCGVVIALLAAAALVITGCNRKIVDNNNNGPGPGQWHLELRAPAVMYRDAAQHHVINDTIIVRLFDANGSVADNVLISAQTYQDPSTVTQSMTSKADTIHFPVGCQPAMMYWGSGSTDPAVPEVITAQAIVNNDTAARAEIHFLVHDAVQLMLFGRDTLYRNAQGRVNYDTISVRLFNDTGGLLAGVPITCRCLLSPDSVTPNVVSYSDTLTHPCGSNPAVRYWGGGDRTEPDREETITCQAVVNGDTTTAYKSFFIRDR